MFYISIPMPRHPLQIPTMILKMLKVVGEMDDVEESFVPAIKPNMRANSFKKR